jgi:hypothetical protein
LSEELWLRCKAAGLCPHRRRIGIHRGLDKADNAADEHKNRSKRKEKMYDQRTET